MRDAYVCAVILAGFLAGAAAAPPPAPVQLTEIEKLRVDQVNLMEELRKAVVDVQACRGDLAKARADQLGLQVVAATQQLRLDVEANHPGYWWNPATGDFQKKPEGGARDDRPAPQ